jgi:hypothetical protein
MLVPSFAEYLSMAVCFCWTRLITATRMFSNVLNSALANDAMAFADGMVSRHKDFVAIATANTYGNGATAEYVGRNPIDKALLNRFATIDIDIDENVEDAMLNSVGLSLDVSRLWITAIRRARANVFSAGLRVLVTPRNTLNGAKQISAGDGSCTSVCDTGYGRCSSLSSWTR